MDQAILADNIMMHMTPRDREIMQSGSLGLKVVSFVLAVVIYYGGGFILFCLLLGAPVFGHEAKTWAYPQECCSGHDCVEVADERVEMTPNGYLVDKKHWMQYRDTRVSPDGKFHACIITTRYWTRLRCFFAPLPSMM